MTERVAEKLLWLDLETSGLDPTRHSILELAFLVTDLQGQLPRANCRGVRSYDDVINWDPFCVNMHQENGLISEMKDGDARAPLHFAFEKMTALVEASARGSYRIAGRGCHFDLSFLRVASPWVGPKFWEKISHRVVDVASIEFFESVVRGVDVAQKVKPHRAMPDLVECIAHYRKLMVRS